MTTSANVDGLPRGADDRDRRARVSACIGKRVRGAEAHPGLFPQQESVRARATREWAMSPDRDDEAFELALSPLHEERIE
jgi:hypothetical protein